MKIVIVEDHQLVRDSFRAMIEYKLGYEVVGEAEDAHTATQVIRQADPDVVLLDLQLKNSHGFEVAANVAKENLRARCLFMSAECNDRIVAMMSHMGAAGFIDKNQSGLVGLGEALHAVASGKTYFSKFYLAAALKIKSAPTFYERLLTLREIKVLSMIGGALDNKEIAARLVLSRETAAKHRKHIMQKLEIHDTPKLVKFAIEAGFTKFVASVCVVIASGFFTGICALSEEAACLLG